MSIWCGVTIGSVIELLAPVLFDNSRSSPTSPFRRVTAASESVPHRPRMVFLWPQPLHIQYEQFDWMK